MIGTFGVEKIVSVIEIYPRSYVKELYVLEGGHILPKKIASLGRIDALGNTLKEVKERPCNLLIANTMVKTKSIYDHLFSNLILDEGYVFVKIDSQTLIIYFISSISKVHFID